MPGAVVIELIQEVRVVSAEEKAAIRDLAARYGAGQVLLFGSSVNDDNAADIDLAVEGLAPRSFFAFYGDLMFRLSRPVDLVDLGRDSLFNGMVRREGVVVYG